MTVTMRTKTLIALLLAALALGACRGKSDEVPAEGPAEATEQVADESAPDVPEAPAVDLWTPVSGLLAGSYGGQCSTVPDVKPAPDALDIGVDGKIVSGTFTGSLRKMELDLMRQIDVNGAMVYSAAASDDNMMLNLMTRDGGQTGNAVFKAGERGLNCDKAPRVLAMGGKPLYSLFASAFDSPPRKLRCLSMGSMAYTQIDYQAANGVITVANQRYDSAEASMEKLSIGEEHDSLAYAMMYGTERNMLIIFNRSGKLKSVTVTGKEPSMQFACDDLHQE